MSRIEMAMEKAARLRAGKDGADDGGEAKEAAVEHPAPYGKLAPKNPLLVGLHDPFSPTAEEYRKLKSALVQISKGQEGVRNSLVVTSSVPCEGKSLTALNLAISLSQEFDHTVLLIDADLRKPSLHSYLGIERGGGLSDVLLDRLPMAEAVIGTGIGKLSLLRAGSPVDNPAELFSSSKMKKMVAELRNAFPDRYLIFDTPPVLPFAETRSLASLVDGVLFVIMERLVSQANVHEALEVLKQCQIFGTVYNGAFGGKQEERYSHYHGYYHRHENEGEAEAVSGPACNTST